MVKGYGQMLVVDNQAEPRDVGRRSSTGNWSELANDKTHI